MKMKQPFLRMMLYIFSASTLSYWVFEKYLTNNTNDPGWKIVYMALGLVGLPVVFSYIEKYTSGYIGKIKNEWIVDLVSLILFIANLILIGLQIGEKF